MSDILILLLYTETERDCLAFGFFGIQYLVFTGTGLLRTLSSLILMREGLPCVDAVLISMGFRPISMDFRLISMRFGLNSIAQREESVRCVFSLYVFFMQGSVKSRVITQAGPAQQANFILDPG